MLISKKTKLMFLQVENITFRKGHFSLKGLVVILDLSSIFFMDQPAFATHCIYPNSTRDLN